MGSEKTITPSPASAIENSVYKITLDKNGDIISLTDKRNNKELVKDGKAIRLALFTENKSYSWPAWEILKDTNDREPDSITDDGKRFVSRKSMANHSSNNISASTKAAVPTA